MWNQHAAFVHTSDMSTTRVTATERDDAERTGPRPVSGTERQDAERIAPIKFADSRID